MLTLESSAPWLLEAHQTVSKAAVWKFSDVTPLKNGRRPFWKKTEPQVGSGGRDRKTKVEVGTQESGRAEPGPEGGPRDITVPKPWELEQLQLGPSPAPVGLQIRAPKYQEAADARHQEPVQAGIGAAAGSVRSSSKGPDNNHRESW